MSPHGPPSEHTETFQSSLVMSEPFPPVRPTRPRQVRELLIEAGQDVSAWGLTKDNRVIVRPNMNTSRNTAWVFPGKDGEPLVACIWFNALTITDAGTFYVGNDRAYRQRLLDRDRGERHSDIRGNLKRWTFQSLKLDLAIQSALKHTQPVRVILVDGDDVDEAEADRGSEVSARALDPETWWVHEYDDTSGRYRLVRGGLPPERRVEDEESGIADLGDDPLLQEFVQTLDDTERDAVIKARVGQGPYRDALFERWGGCSVTNVKLKELLTASHIKPWSRCEVAKERVSVSNGLLLVPTLDRLFDRGYITFDDNFKICISSRLTDAQRVHLGIDRNMQLRIRHFDDLKPYLNWHRQEIFIP
ncbi:HNH endonuclease [Paraburkholderia sabiae]|uniref:HNH endonuclease n=1 Tax=Paraburkholderia sabiae TaxID=273251 RepID=A0ABU9QL60_9BURK|nr:HNH endonuclease [Paraburkholderia sabiae]WJZ77401.1 HNH endonuclease [Paraburkholderia sabiae]CAD6547397.1 hypothetical protein LMG24235_04414 [Paraburkholderia sabiae]